MTSIQDLYRVYREARTVSIDTRTIGMNDLFFALKGPRFDANTMAKEALEKGASFAIIDDSDYYLDERTILVSNTLETLQDLARYRRARMNFPVFGITGSNGKTTTKELLHQVLLNRFRTNATVGNLNNHIGLPLTLLRTPDECQFLIVEMGSNQPGDISFLCTIADPDYGLITNIGATHLEGLIDQNGVLNEKRALYDYITQKGKVFFLNTGDIWLQSLPLIPGKTIGYHALASDSCSIKPLDTDDFRLKFEIKTKDAISNISTHLYGRYNLENISAAITVGSYFGISMDKMLKNIAEYRPDNMRSQIIRTETNEIILDGYNANPSSMRASLNSFIDGSEKEKVAILGDMLELGDNEEAFHREIVEWLASRSDLEVYYVGKNFFNLSPKICFQKVEDLNEFLIEKPMTGKQIFIKGSRGIQLEKVIPFL